MVNAVGGGSKPSPAKKVEEKKEEEGKKPASQAPAPSPSPAPTEKPNTGNTGSQDTNLPKGGLDPKAAFQVSQNLKKKEPASGGSDPETTENAGETTNGEVSKN